MASYGWGLRPHPLKSRKANFIRSPIAQNKINKQMAMGAQGLYLTSNFFILGLFSHGSAGGAWPWESAHAESRSPEVAR